MTPEERMWELAKDYLCHDVDDSEPHMAEMKSLFLSKATLILRDAVAEAQQERDQMAERIIKIFWAHCPMVTYVDPHQALNILDERLAALTRTSTGDTT